MPFALHTSHCTLPLHFVVLGIYPEKGLSISLIGSTVFGAMCLLSVLGTTPSSNDVATANLKFMTNLCEHLYDSTN